jgi:hypothetical protein
MKLFNFPPFLIDHCDSIAIKRCVGTNQSKLTRTSIFVYKDSSNQKDLFLITFQVAFDDALVRYIRTSRWIVMTALPYSMHPNAMLVM